MKYARYLALVAWGLLSGWCVSMVGRMPTCDGEPFSASGAWTFIAVITALMVCSFEAGREQVKEETE